MTGTLSDLCTSVLVIIEVRSASQPHIRPRSSKSRFQARHGVVGDVADSFRQLMPAAMTSPVSSSSSPSATYSRRASARPLGARPTMGGRADRRSQAASTLASDTAAARAAAVSDARVEAAWDRLSARPPIVGLAPRGRADALRLYVALGDELDETGDVIAAGINCLNESATSPTTPCLAWNLLFEERGLMWGCEADLTSMITKTLVHKSLKVPVMMTNLYPYLMGQAALKHERIPFFPRVDSEPENHVLVAHCGFFGVVPQSFATEWTLRPRVLEIVDPNANVIDARFAEGSTTIVKIASDMKTLTVAPSVLTGYHQFKNSDCLNGAVLRVEDGYRFVENLPSHHAILATGDLVRRLEVMSSVLGLDVLKI